MEKRLSYLAYNQRAVAGWTLPPSRSTLSNTYSDPS